MGLLLVASLLLPVGLAVPGYQLKKRTLHIVSLSVRLRYDLKHQLTFDMWIAGPLEDFSS